MLRVWLCATCLLVGELGCGARAATAQEPSGGSPSDPQDNPGAEDPALAVLGRLGPEWPGYVTSGRVTLGGMYGVVDPEPDDDDDDDHEREPPCADEDEDRQHLLLALGLRAPAGANGNSDETSEGAGADGKPTRSVGFDTTSECEEFMVALADASPKEVLGSPQFSVEISLGRVRSEGRVVFATSTNYCRYHICEGDYLSKSGLVALRLAFLGQYSGMGTNELSPLGLWVKPLSEFAKYFSPEHEPRYIGTRGPFIDGVSYID